MPKYTKEQTELYTSIYKKLLSILKYNTSIGQAFESELKSALEQGFPIDFTLDFTPYKRYGTLLHIAIRLQNDAVVYLLHAGADVNVLDCSINVLDCSLNALMLAIYHENPAKIIREILKRTEDINYKNNKGYSALALLCREAVLSKFRDWQNDLAVLNMLLKAGASTEGLEAILKDSLESAQQSLLSIYDSGTDQVKRVKKLTAYIANFQQQQKELKTKGNEAVCLSPILAYGKNISFYEYEL